MTAQEAANSRLGLLSDYLATSARIAQRLSWSIGRLARMMPLDEAAVRELSDADAESFDALLHRFASLTSALQDSLGRSILAVEEEDLSDKSRKDQRLLLEKLGALDPTLRFGEMAELRNRIAHRYPDDPARQADILNAVFSRAGHAIEVFNGMRAFADERHFDGSLAVRPVAPPTGGQV